MAVRIEADLILYNGRIWCGREEGSCEAVAVWQGKVLATGSSAEMLNLKGSRTEVIDLDGRFASPGLIDNHLHLISTGIVMAGSGAAPAGPLKSSPNTNPAMGVFSPEAVDSTLSPTLLRALTVNV